IIAVIVSLGINAPYVIDKFQTDEPTQIGVIAGSSDIVAPLIAWSQSQEEPEIEIQTFADQGSDASNEQALKAKIKDGTIEGYLTFGDLDEAGFPLMAFKSEKT